MNNKRCNEVPKGNGYCDKCAAGLYEQCRYMEAESKQAEIADIHKHYAEEAWNLAGETSELIGKLAQANEELDKANARISQLEECLVPFMKIISTSSGRIQTEKLSFADWHGMIKAASTTSDTWLSQHDKSVEVKVLEEVSANVFISTTSRGDTELEQMIEARK